MQASELSQMQNSEDGEATSSSFPKRRDERGFNVTDEGCGHPPQIPVDSRV